MREDWQQNFTPDIPSPARIYDYLLGGKDNYPADRSAADEVEFNLPNIRTTFQWNRAFLRRAVRYMVHEAGIRQFLDIGTGLPTVGNVHEVAQDADPSARVVYVDNDPVVLAHGRALLHDETGTVILEHDLRRPAELLADPELRAMLDFSEPVGVLLIAILHFIDDEADPARIIRQLMEPLPSGSHLAFTHATAENNPGMDKAAAVYRQATASAHPRNPDHIRSLFRGLDMLEPGLVWLPEWRPDPGTVVPPNAKDAYFYAAVVRKP
jgi:hypothetical protein